MLQPATQLPEVQIAVLGHPGHRVSCNDLELEVDQDNVASLPTIMKLLITCHFPLHRGLHTGL